MSRINIGVIGFGTVGAGTVENLLKNRDLINNKTGLDIYVKKIADLDIESDRGITVDPGVLTTDAMSLINNPEIDIVIELMGGMGKAKEFILAALNNKKHVVTANKALLAEYGKELYETAEKNGVTLAFEASVAGGIPIIRSLREGLAANRIETIKGILNGTSNYILTRMTRENLPYDQAVKEAIDLGYAEDPPDLDVNGTDAAHKLAILISITFGIPIPFEDIYREGIDQLTKDDILYANELGYCLKLLAVAQNLGDRVEARVHPAMVPMDHIIANVNDAYNAIYIEGDFVGPNLSYGLGAGRKATGSAVVSDIMTIARQISLGVKTLMPPLGHVRPGTDKITVQPMDDLITEYYFRFSAVDKPGVLSKIAGILGDHEISIASVIQKGRTEEGPVSLVMLTHEAKEKNVIKSLGLIDKLDVLTHKTMVIRVEKGQN